MNAAQSDDLFTNLTDVGSDDVGLLDPRKVNREISAQLATERQADRMRRISAGTHTTLLRDACRRHANDPHKQLNYFLQKATLPAATGRRREVSEKTRTDFGEIIHRAFHELKEERRPIHSLSELGRAHVLALVVRWARQGNGAATIQTKVSFFRRFLTLVGKPDAIPKGREWNEMLKAQGVDRTQMLRANVLAESKTWLSRGLDPFQIFKQVAEKCPVIALQLEMQLAFGLRVKESFHIEPTVGGISDGLLVVSGAKGGRPRLVEFDTDPQTRDWQEDVLNRAKLVAIHHPQKRLALRGLTLAQMRNRYNYLMRLNGITGKGLGVTSHALRHQYAARRFAALSGLPAPAEGTVPADEYTSRSEAVSAARQDVSQQLGHWRESVTSAYLGSVPTMAKEARRRIDGWLAALQSNQAAAAALRAAGVSEAWLTGRAGMGLALRPGERLHLFVRLNAEPTSESVTVPTALRLEALQNALALAVDFEIAVLIWTYAGRPDDGVEVLFNRSRNAAPPATATS